LAHGVETEGGRLDGDIPTLAEILKRQGYRTVGVYSAPYLDPYWGFDRGFDVYQPVYGDQAAVASERVAAIRHEAERAAAAGEWSRYDELKKQQAGRETELNDSSQIVVTSEQTATAAVEHIDTLTRAGQPWLVFAHFFDAHCDYVPPPPYDRRFDPDYTGSFTGKGCMGGPAVGMPDPDRPGALLRTIAARDLEHAFALYEGEVAWVDEHVGRILRALEASGAASRTLVVVTSDHGEEFFEHAGLGHRRTLYEEVVRTPLLLRLPGVLPAGKVVRGAVSGADLLPTILELLGLPAEPTAGAASFLPLIAGGTGDHPVLLRTVIMFSGEVRVDGEHVIPLRQVVVQDAYRRGAIKITRKRSWPQFHAGVSADVHAILQREAAAQYAREELHWVDVERFPDEPETQHSADFSDAAARAALAAFRADYTALLARRNEQRQASAIPHNVRQALESLGYIERATGPSFPEPDLVLPAPE
jgi:hypothetical protein